MANITNFKKVLGGVSGKAYKKILAKSDGRVLWSAGSTVTYVVDSGVSYTEEVDSGASCLSPKTFTPSKDGWTFVGWREDTTASGSVLSSKVMESDPITLYAVFEQTVTAKFVSYNSTQTVDGTRYYNNSNVENASVTVPTGATYSGWSWRGWSNNWVADAAADVVYANGSTVYGLSEDRTYYGLYQQTITEKFIDYDGSKNNEYPQYATTYYNSAGNTSYSNITVPNAAEWSGMAFQGWSYPNSNSFDVNVTAGQVLQSTADCTRYAIYTKTVYLYYNGNGASSGSVTTQSGTVRCNVVGNWSYPSFTLASNGFTRIDYTFNGWNLGAVGATITLSASTTAYAQWTQVSLTLFDGGTFYYDFGVLTECEDTDGLGDGEYASYNKNNGLYMAAYAYYYRIAWVTTSKIDVTNLKTLNFNISGITSVGDATWMIGLQSTRKVTKAWDNNDAYNVGYGNTLSAGTISLDVSGLSGSYYVIIQIDSCNRKTLGFTATKGWFAV